MKVISIWQPFASLIIEGCKVFETRTWAAPKSVIGTRIGIAATKTYTSGQRSHCADEEFRDFYSRTGLDDWTTLPRGALLGTVLLDSVEVMSEELMDDVSREEQAYGWWEIGGYAWRLRDPVKFAEPIPLRGQQGLYDWKGLDVHTGTISKVQEESDQADQGRKNGSQALRGYLRVI